MYNEARINDTGYGESELKSPEKRETEISRVLSRLESSVSGLEEQVSLIENRLEGVTNGGGVESSRLAGAMAKPSECSTPLGNKINNYVEAIQALNSRLSGLRNRIEL